MNARVHRDDWGVPHLRADDHLELARAQGANAATDRAWQLEVERHRAQGSSAAFLGPAELDWDRFARRARLVDTARRCFERLDPDTAAWVRAYVAGVNSALPQAASAAPEFARTGLAAGRWEPWTPLALWLSHHVLFAGLPAKLWRERAAAVLGEEALGYFATDGPATSGSNGWLVTGERTATGAALIAGDPHRFIEDPGLYQQIRLACPEYDVIGLAVPGVPGIAHFGHTGGVAWAITNAMADYQDLYRERLRRTDHGVEALGPDGWRPAHAHTERIQVAGAPDVEVEVIETERGPVVLGEDLSLRHPPRVTGELGFATLPALLRARTVAELDAALEHWVEPVNVVLAADTAGATLHRVAGRVPRRDRANLLRPVPAWLARHAWTGWHHPLPRAEVTGHAVMANARGLAAPLGVEFAAPHRAERIDELLRADDRWTAEAMASVHTDTRLAAAEPLLRLLARQTGLTAEAAELRDQLLDWDRRMAADSVAAGRFAALRSAVVRAVAALPVLAPLAEPGGHPALFAPWLSLTARVGFALEHLLVPGRLPGLDPAAVVRAALDQVAGQPARAWGETHRLAPWRAVADPDWTEPPLGGDHDCVLATTSVPGITDRCGRASAARYAWDLADRSASRWVVPLGAGGPGHRHDQLPLWLSGRLIPATTQENP
ncbi:penicillin acylase family protein [Kitasatospora viridis]|uniref:Penicillin amidase n=1 Tax=Kitasatospora viridis TaxID=281105 RepID=A0A561TUX5_9ACTN|nr:penicillin acylase family protein [Kitasatospora viridis]TWF90913.1 penicillin amidase [Kitasatospora viridis]